MVINSGYNIHLNYSVFFWPSPNENVYFNVLLANEYSTSTKLICIYIASGR